MRSIAIVMAYHDRKPQLLRTLASIVNSHHEDYYIVIVDDASPEQACLDLPEVRIMRIEPDQKAWVGPVIAFNTGIACALRLDTDIILIQNPECEHVGDVLMYANDHVTDDNYISFACWNQEHGDSMEQTREKIARDDPNRTDGGGTGWYNHPCNPRGYHFCAAMTRQTMVELNGFDERFKDGLCYDDDDLVGRVRLLGRGFIVTDETKPFVVHQWHSRKTQSHKEVVVNRLIYDRLRYRSDYKAVHLITEDFEYV